MYGIIIFLLLLAALCLLVFQPLYINVLLCEGYKIEFDYSFITLILRSSPRRVRTKKRKKKSKLLFSTIAFLKKLISNSKITLNKLVLPNAADEPQAYAINYAFIKFVLSTGALCLFYNSKNLSISSDAITAYDTHSDNEAFELNFSLQTTLLFFIYSALIFSYEMLKRRIKDIKNERKQGQ